MNGLRLSDISSILRRRFWLVIVCVTLFAPIGVAIAYMLPPSYKATATILVRDQQIPGPLAQTTVTQSAFERLNEISNRLLTRENLLELIRELELYEDQPEISPGQQVALMRQNIEIRPDFISQSRTMQKLTKFRVSFSDARPGRAARVANALADVILTWNIEDRTQQANQTKEFFESQVNDLQERISLKQQEINAYQAENLCCLPNTLTQRQGQLANLQSQSIQREQNLFTLREQIRTMQEQLDNGVLQTTAQKTPAERQLEALELQRVQMLVTFSEQSTKVQQIDAQIAQLRELIGTTNGSGGTVLSPAEFRVQQQIEGIRRQIELTEEQEKDSLQKQAELEASIEDTAAVGVELNRLNNELMNLQAQHAEATRDFNAAQTGAILETNRQAERFELSDSAQVPGAADSPNRKVIAAGGVFAGVLFGAALMALFEFLDKSIRTSHAMEHRVGLRPVVSIPYVMTVRERIMRRMRWAAFFLTLLIVVPAALYAVDTYVMPLEELLAMIGQKTGLDKLIATIQTTLGL